MRRSLARPRRAADARARRTQPGEPLHRVDAGDPALVAVPRPRPGDPVITPALVAEHGITPEEYQRLVAMLDREPTFTELGIVSALWNEHCSYKHSRPILRTLPTTAPYVLQGPGENAGVIAIGDGLAVAFKI